MSSQPEIKVENIRKATFNGRKVKLFDLRRKVDGGWLFQGTYSAPYRVANKDLLTRAVPVRG